MVVIILGKIIIPANFMKNPTMASRVSKARKKATLVESLKSAILSEDACPNSTSSSVAKGVEALKTSDDQPKARNY